MYVCLPFIPSARRSQKSVLDPMELELQMVVSCHFGCWNVGSLEE